jgi:hypothetical protein
MVMAGAEGGWEVRLLACSRTCVRLAKGGGAYWAAISASVFASSSALLWMAAACSRRFRASSEASWACSRRTLEAIPSTPADK